MATPTEPQTPAARRYKALFYVALGLWVLTLLAVYPIARKAYAMGADDGRFLERHKASAGHQ